MGAIVSNCKKCNKVFQLVRQPYCPDCSKKEDEKFSLLYRILQNSATSGGISIDELASATKVPLEHIEKFYMDGSFGTASVYLHIYCQSCGAQCKANQRLGRYCVACSEVMANKAGVEVKNMRELNKRKTDAELLQQQAGLLHDYQARRANFNRFGSAVK